MNASGAAGRFGLVVGIVTILAWLAPDPVARLLRTFMPAPSPQVQTPVVNVEVVNNVLPSSIIPPPRPRQQSTGDSGSSPLEPKQEPMRDDDRSHYLRPNLEPLNTGTSRWSVLVFGDHRAGDIAMSLTDALSQHGKDTVVLFRDESIERGVAPDLFRGNASLVTRLNLARYCDHLLVGRVQTLSLGSTDGLVVARAVLNVRLLDGNGRAIGDFEVTEKGGGLTEDAAIANAIVALRDAVPGRISELL